MRVPDGIPAETILSLICGEKPQGASLKLKLPQRRPRRFLSVRALPRRYPADVLRSSSIRSRSRWCGTRRKRTIWGESHPSGRTFTASSSEDFSKGEKLQRRAGNSSGRGSIPHDLPAKLTKSQAPSSCIQKGRKSRTKPASCSREVLLHAEMGWSMEESGMHSAREDSPAERNPGVRMEILQGLSASKKRAHAKRFIGPQRKRMKEFTDRHQSSSRLRAGKWPQMISQGRPAAELDQKFGEASLSGFALGSTQKPQSGPRRSG